MFSLFHLDHFPDRPAKVNLDDLFAKRKEKDLRRLALHQRMLQALHRSIRTVSRRPTDNTSLWYTVPDVVLYATCYDPAHFIAFALDALRENAFHAEFIPPNTLFVSWAHYVPTYVRDQIRRQLGIRVDALGRVAAGPPAGGSGPADAPGAQDRSGAAGRAGPSGAAASTDIRSTDDYQPTGRLYDRAALDRLRARLRQPLT